MYYFHFVRCEKSMIDHEDQLSRQVLSRSTPVGVILEGPETIYIFI